MASIGRPRSFDKETALKRAMHVFWEKGYEGATMSDLIESIGVKAPSVYAAFGNKDAIFMESLAIYRRMMLNGPLKALETESEIYNAISKLLNNSATLNKNPSNPVGCLIMTAAINSTPEHINIVEELRSIRSEYKAALTSRFEKAMLDRQINQDTSAEDLAEYYLTIIHGLALRAKDGSTYKEIMNTIYLALLALKSKLCN